MNKDIRTGNTTAEPVPVNRMFRPLPTPRGREADRLAKLAVRQAMIEHKEAGLPVATWEDGKVVWVAAEDIVISDEE